jgi:hypothetical protein
MTEPPSPRLARRGVPAGPSGAGRGLTRRHHQCGAGPDGWGAPPLERRRRPRAALPLFPRPTLFRIHGDCLQNPWWQRRVRNDGTARVLRQATTARSRPRRSAAQHAPMREIRQVGPEVGPISAFYGCIPTGMHGPTRIVWAQLTPLSLTKPTRRRCPSRVRAVD